MFVGDFKTPLDPAEGGNLSIEFTGDLAPGVTVQSIVSVLFTAIKQLPGATADPNPTKNGSASIVTVQDPARGPRTYVVQNCSGVDGNRYRLWAQVRLSDNSTPVRYGHVWCRAPS